MTKRVVTYSRVSTDDQADHGYSLPSQVEANRFYTERLGYQVTAELREDVSGAIPINERPEGQRMADMIKRREVDAVVVYQVDRLSRDIVDLLATVRTWLRAGVEVYAGDVGKVESELDIVLVIKGWQGSDERKKIIERTSRGRYRKAKEGKAVGSGTPPYGYNYLDGELTIKEPEAGVVRMIFRWYTEGDELGKRRGTKTIGEKLTESGFPTPAESKGWKKKRKRAAGIWDTSTVNWILSSETYCGILRYGKFIGKNGRGGKRPEAEHVKINAPAIIHRETWERAQELRKVNYRMLKRRAILDYLLRGTILCGCGYHFVGANGYYRCTRKYQNTGKRCDERAVNMQAIESHAWEYVLGIINDPKGFENNLRRAQKAELEATQPRRDEIESIDALIAQAETEANDIAQALRKAKGIVSQTLENQSDEINARYDALVKRRAHLEDELSKQTITDEAITNLLLFREDVARGMENPTPEDKRQCFEALQLQVLINDGKATFTCKLAVKPVEHNLIQDRTSKNSKTKPRKMC